MSARIVVYRDTTGEYRWSHHAGNGEIVADSAEGYVNREHAIERATIEGRAHGVPVLVDEGDGEIGEVVRWAGSGVDDLNVVPESAAGPNGVMPTGALLVEGQLLVPLTGDDRGQWVNRATGAQGTIGALLRAVAAEVP